MKYTKEKLEEAVQKSNTLSDVLRLLGINVTGSNHRHIKSRIVKYEIDISHFYQKSYIRNLNKLSPEQILVNNRFDRRDSSKIIRRALLESGIEYRCSLCPIIDEWNGQKLVLQVDHIDGNGLNNNIENLRFLCPNCHSQTGNFGSKKSKKIKVKKQRPRKVERPSKESLEKLVWQKPTTEIGKMFGVSDNAVAKWCKNYGIAKPPRGYWTKNIPSQLEEVYEASVINVQEG